MRRSQRIKQQNPAVLEKPALKMSNRFELKETEKVDKHSKAPSSIQQQTSRSKMVNSDIVQNLSDIDLSTAEQSVGKRFEFLPNLKIP